MTFQHYSVLLNETIEQLDIKENGIYVDGTLGGGGHASAVLQRLGETGRLIGIDQDAAAIEAAGERLAPFGDKVTIVRSNYSAMPQVLADLGIRVTDRATCFNLILGLNGYTPSAGIYIEELGGGDLICKPLALDETIHIGAIAMKDSVRSEIGRKYLEFLKKYLIE